MYINLNLINIILQITKKFLDKKSLVNELVLNKKKRQLINYRLDLIYNKIDKSVEDLKFIKNFIKIDYLLNNDFVDRLYKKIAEAYDKIRDFTYDRTSTS